MEDIMTDGKRRRTINPTPMGRHMSQRSEREWIARARQRFLDLSPEEQIAHGGSLVFPEPTPQTSKGRNIKRRAYKRAKRLEQAQ